MMRRWRTMARPALVSTVVVAVGWIGGFIWFVNATWHIAGPPPAHADGIVALTGGAGRVEMALRLLVAGQADRLLVSGIGGGIDLGILGHRAGLDLVPFADRITLGRYAASTRGNGVEAAAWAEQNNIRSLIVVTAAYHMPRALAELRHALPDVHLFPLPVQPGAERLPGFRLEAEEFTKYLMTISGLSGWFPRRESGPMLSTPSGAGR